jgi:hypothetical protein
MYIIAPELGSGQYHHGVSKVSGDRAVLVVSICGLSRWPSGMDGVGLCDSEGCGRVG